MTGGDRCHVVPQGKHLDHGLRKVPEASQQLGSVGGPRSSRSISHGDSQQVPSHRLGVKSLGGGHAHLHVPAIGRVQHPIGPVNQVAVTTVHDGHDSSTPSPHEVHGAVGIGRRPRLADRHYQGVGHVGSQTESRQLGGRAVLHVDRSTRRHPGQFGLQRTGDRTAGHGGSALADDQDPANCAISQRSPYVATQRVVTEAYLPASGPSVVAKASLDQSAPQGGADRVRRFADLFQQEVGVVPPVDVSGGDLGSDHVLAGDRQRAPIVGPAGQALKRPS